MSEVILRLAGILLNGDFSNAKEVDNVVRVTIAAWNKGMYPAERQAALERDIIDTLTTAEEDSEAAAAFVQALRIVDARRRALYPNLRRLVLNHNLKMAGGKVALNVTSTPIGA